MDWRLIGPGIVAAVLSYWWYRWWTRKQVDFSLNLAAGGDLHDHQGAAPCPSERAKPRLVVRHVRTEKYLIPFLHPSGPVIDSIEVFDFIEVGVVNEPEIWSQKRESAMGVEAHISFFDQDGTLLFGPLEHGRWRHIPEPDDERFLDQCSRSDVPANDMVKWFYIALKAETDADAFGFSNKSIVLGDKWRIDQWRLRPGRYLVTARLVGQNVDQTFWFRLEIPSAIGVSPLLERAAEPVVSNNSGAN